MATARANPRPGFPIGLTLVMLVAMAILIGLGVWQVKRLRWKEHLLAEVAAAQNAPPEPLQVVLGQGVDGLDTDYRKVQLDCPGVETTPFIKLYALRDAVQGYRIVTACSLSGAAYGSILVDRGFVSNDDAARLKPGAGLPVSEPLIGVLRRGDKRNFVTPPNQPGQGLWYWRDIPAIAAAVGARNPAPTFMMLQSPAPKDFGPTPAPTPTDIPNNHLQYAGTWFGLAIALAGVYLAMLWRRRSQ